MPDVLIYGDTERSPALRHEVPLAIGDPFLYIERGNRRIILTNVTESARVARVVPEAELLLPEQLGQDELIDAGLSYAEIALEITARAVATAGVQRAIVPAEFPLALADRLRADGVMLTADEEAFDLRRRVKTPAELVGIRRAQVAAHAGMAAAAALLAAADIAGDTLHRDGRPLLAEDVRHALRAACAQAGAFAPPDVMVTSLWSGGGHDPGIGPLPTNLPITIDLWPRDEATGCWADMTRTFVAGDVSAPVATLRDTVRAALEAARALIRPGVTGRDAYSAAAQIIEDAGHPTQRTAAPGEALDHGFYFSLGHGVGLDVHEAPSLGRTGHAPFIAGDVVAIEPGIESIPGLGGMRYEDLLLVTEDGCETLTDFSYELQPWLTR